MKKIYVKICGLTRREQAQAISAMGVHALGFIMVPASPRYVTPDQIRDIVAALPGSLDTVGVFRNLKPTEIVDRVISTGLTVVQLHGDETPFDCQILRRQLPSISIIKAFRIRYSQDLQDIQAYTDVVDKVLVDAYHPTMGGGTGLTVDWSLLDSMEWPLPWLLAGGLTPDNVQLALTRLQPDGIDISSGVEHEPGNKDLTKVEQLMTKVTEVVQKK